MNRTLSGRVSRLESRFGTAAQVRLRIGYLTTLPAGFAGERHIVILSRSRTAEGIEICACEERPGPLPAGTEIPDCHVYMDEIDQRL
jgi:hypothetical protein